MSLFSLLNFSANILILFFIPIFIFEFYNRDPTTKFNPIISYSIVIIVFLIWYFGPEEGSNNDNNVQNNYHNNDKNNYYSNDKNYFYDKNNYYNNDKFKNRKNKSYCLQMDAKSYEKIGEMNTNIQLSKLEKTREFQRMYEEKGDNMDNWNWQSRDRLKNKKILNESDIGSDDIENLTLSD